MIAGTTILEENKIKIIISLIFIKLYLLFSYINNHFLALGYFSLNRLLCFLGKFKLKSISQVIIVLDLPSGKVAWQNTVLLDVSSLNNDFESIVESMPYSITSIVCTIIYNNIIRHILHQTLPPSYMRHRFGAILSSEIEKGNLELPLCTNYPCQHACSARKELLVLEHSDHFSAHQSC